MWQKFFLLTLMVVISPHRSKTSLMISSTIQVFKMYFKPSAKHLTCNIFRQATDKNCPAARRNFPRRWWRNVGVRGKKCAALAVHNLLSDSTRDHPFLGRNHAPHHRILGHTPLRTAFVSLPCLGQGLRQTLAYAHHSRVSHGHHAHYGRRVGHSHHAPCSPNRGLLLGSGRSYCHWRLANTPSSSVVCVASWNLMAD